MRNLGCLLILLLLFLSAPSEAFAETARELAKSAYFQIEANVFDPSELSSAIQKLNTAQNQNPKEPFVYLTASLAVLVKGYKIGDWYETRNFAEGSVEQSVKLAEQAIGLNRNLGHSYAHLARLRILTKDFKDAERLINKAKELDKDSFYPWYFEGILYEKQGNVQAATRAFATAESKMTMKHQPTMLNNHRQSLAKLTNDTALQEKLLKENIAHAPNNAHLYGNYGQFLMCQGRFREAVVQWEKALSIATYPRAVEQLEKAKRFVAQNKKEGDCACEPVQCR